MCKYIPKTDTRDNIRSIKLIQRQDISISKEIILPFKSDLSYCVKRGELQNICLITADI
jgi:hypothetical protein